MSGATYVASAEFSESSNPSSNGLWRYGYTNVLGSGFALHPQPIFQAPILGWGSFISGDGNPAIWKNPTTGTYDFGTAFWGPGEISLHPGPNGELAMLRFSAPTAGPYLIEATFANGDRTGASTDVHVLVNNTSIFDAGIGGVGSTAGTTQTVALQVGGTVDLAVGRGTNSFLYDNTRVELRLTPVPEPASWIAMGMGLALLRRRKR